MKLVTALFTTLLTVVTAFSGPIGPHTAISMPHEHEHDTNLNEFPNPSIPPILGIPSYATIAELHLKINANAASVWTTAVAFSAVILYTGRHFRFVSHPFLFKFSVTLKSCRNLRVFGTK
jgi:hypothetical protein